MRSSGGRGDRASRARSFSLDGPAAQFKFYNNANRIFSSSPDNKTSTTVHNVLGRRLRVSPPRTLRKRGIDRLPSHAGRTPIFGRSRRYLSVAATPRARVGAAAIFKRQTPWRPQNHAIHRGHLFRKRPCSHVVAFRSQTFESRHVHGERHAHPELALQPRCVGDDAKRAKRAVVKRSSG